MRSIAPSAGSWQKLGEVLEVLDATVNLLAAEIAAAPSETVTLSLAKEHAEGLQFALMDAAGILRVAQEARDQIQSAEVNPRFPFNQKGNA